jgi:HSP20 family protein
MAETRTTSSEREAARGKESAQAVARNDQTRRGLQRWPAGGRLSFGGPFEMMDRLTEEIDRMFRDFGVPRRWARSPFASLGREGAWAPRIEAFQQGDKFIVRAELPGLRKEDVQVELTDEALTLRGERREEHEEEKEGYYHSEREYGQFHRTIPLPEGVIVESAQATFKNGVLEVSMPAAPSEANRGRRLEIKEQAEGERQP